MYGKMKKPNVTWDPYNWQGQKIDEIKNEIICYL